MSYRLPARRVLLTSMTVALPGVALAGVAMLAAVPPAAAQSADRRADAGAAAGGTNAAILGAGTRPVALPPALATAESRLADALAPGVRATIAEQVAAAERAGIPPAPLVAKALEGVELGAAPPRIVDAVRALLGRLVAARAALTPVVSDAELVSGADALAAGVPATALRRVRAVSQGRSAAVALGVLAQLVARGIAPGRATEAVTALLRRGARPAQLVALDSAVRLDVAAGVPAGAALDARARTLTGGLLLPPGGPAAAGVVNGATTTQSGSGDPRHHP